MDGVGTCSDGTKPNLPYRHFRAYTIAFCYHLSDIMSDSYCSELRLYESLPSITEPLEVIVIFDLSEHGFRLDRSPASMHQAFVTCQQFSGHSTELIVAMVHLNDSRIVFSRGGGMVGIAEACPPPDTGRGRGPQDTSSAIAGRSRLWEGPE